MEQESAQWGCSCPQMMRYCPYSDGYLADVLQEYAFGLQDHINTTKKMIEITIDARDMRPEVSIPNMSFICI